MREIGSSQKQEQKDITACPHRTQQGDRGWTAEQHAMKEIISLTKETLFVHNEANDIKDNT